MRYCADDVLVSMQAQPTTKSAGQNANQLNSAARTVPAPAPARPKPSASKQSFQPATKAESAQTASHRNSGKRMSPAVKRALKVAVDAVWKADSFGVFKLPVTKRVAPDYYQIVKHPMDLKTVRQNLDKGAYEDEHAFKHVRDARTQVFGQLRLQDDTVLMPHACFVCCRTWISFSTIVSYTMASQVRSANTALRSNELG